MKGNTSPDTEIKSDIEAIIQNPWNIWDNVPASKMLCIKSLCNFFGEQHPNQQIEMTMGSAWSLLADFRKSGACNCEGNTCHHNIPGLDMSRPISNNWIMDLNCYTDMHGLL